jgi:hypothetical protein
MKYIEEEKTHEITVKILRNADMIEINTDKNPIVLSR